MERDGDNVDFSTHYCFDWTVSLCTAAAYPRLICTRRGSRTTLISVSQSREQKEQHRTAGTFIMDRVESVMMGEGGGGEDRGEVQGARHNSFKYSTEL